MERNSLLRQLVGINLGLVAVQAISAGFMMSGSARALRVHMIVAVALQLGTLVQAVAAVVLWRRHRVPGANVSACVALFVIVVLQAGLGFRKSYWLHVPIGVGIFGGLTRQADRLDARRDEAHAGVHPA
jgi:hypothetical protein